MPSNDAIPNGAAAAVLVKSEEIPDDVQPVHGYDFKNGVDYNALLNTYVNTGFQASNFGRAVDIVNNMRAWRLSDDPVADNKSTEDRDPEFCKNVKCKIFLGYTSNLISSGIRETIKYLVKNSMADVVVSTAGSIEEDIIKCLAPTYIGNFALEGQALRSKGLNRVGNLIQKEDGTVWTPSKVIHRLGKEADHPDSVYYWAYKNNIPVYCPTITDGSLGDMLYFHSFRNPGLVIDVVQDIQAMNTEAVNAKKTGMLILGSGLVKHHICNANLMRNGADYAVFVNTAQEFDGSDAGARPDEAVSWGKIKADAESVKVHADVSLVFPLLVAQTFAKSN
ncbi:Deoxyhypusine synthase [Coemansia sp. RSA 1972]|nr:Deoxyhypusine synthase [Coemansia sp. RSA 1972]